MAKGDPKVHSKDEDYSGTKMGSPKGAMQGPVGINAHSKDEDFSGTKANTHRGDSESHGNAGSMSKAVGHLKAHHSAKHHMVGKHKMG